MNFAHVRTITKPTSSMEATNLMVIEPLISLADVGFETPGSTQIGPRLPWSPERAIYYVAGDKSARPDPGSRLRYREHVADEGRSATELAPGPDVRRGQIVSTCQRSRSDGQRGQYHMWYPLTCPGVQLSGRLRRFTCPGSGGHQH